MKLHHLALLAALCTPSLALAARPAKPAAARPAGSVARLKIEGMDCEGCAGSLVTAFKKLKGVTAARVDVKAGTGAVTYDPKLRKPADFVASAREAGYTARIVN